MISTTIEKDVLSTGVTVSTIRIEDAGSVWYETLAYIAKPFFCGDDPWIAETEEEAHQNHANRIYRAMV